MSASLPRLSVLLICSRSLCALVRLPTLSLSLCEPPAIPQTDQEDCHPSRKHKDSPVASCKVAGGCIRVSQDAQGCLLHWRRWNEGREHQGTGQQQAPGKGQGGQVRSLGQAWGAHAAHNLPSAQSGCEDGHLQGWLVRGYEVADTQAWDVGKEGGKVQAHACWAQAMQLQMQAVHGVL